MNTIIRTAVAALALTGSAAYVNLSTTAIKPIVTKTNFAPAPICTPDGKTSCGLGSPSH